MAHTSFPRKLFLLAATSIALACPMAFAQGNAPPGAAADTASSPSFDVATIKQHPGMAYSQGLRYQPDGFTGSVTLPMLLQFAYGVLTEDQVTGTPDWAKNQWFDIQAKMSEADIAAMQKMSAADSNARRQLMMRTLLADRFKLKVHSATKQVPVYDLVVAKGGTKLKDAATDSDPNLEKNKDGKPSTGFHFMKDTSTIQGYSMASLANFLSQPVTKVGRPVVDKTGLTSTYDFTLDWSVYTQSAPDEEPPVFGALREVGLKLQPSTGPVESIVIDNVERPSEN